MEEYEDKVRKIIEEIKNKVKEYVYLEIAGNEAECKSAYVVFQSMEGRARFLRTYNYNKCERSTCCRFLFGSKEYKKKLFEGRWLQVLPAPEPSLILWENLGIQKKMRNCRIFATSMASLIFVLAAITAIVYARQFDKQNKDSKPNTTCPE